ncbi:hypothetical protein MMC17_004137 [Xylographa soralifera]|nr:hypothetical protein [Xylographa soralifera]
MRKQRPSGEQGAGQEWTGVRAGGGLGLCGGAAAEEREEKWDGRAFGDTIRGGRGAADRFAHWVDGLLRGAVDEFLGYVRMGVEVRVADGEAGAVMPLPSGVDAA